MIIYPETIGGYYQKSIILQTSKGNNISNSNNWIENSPLFQYQLKKIRQQYPGLIVRNGPSGVYNCHGFTFASRRTCIFESTEIQKILNDDNYKAIKNPDVLPGDIALYFGNDGDIEHSAIVTKEPDVQLKIPIVISKWGTSYEIIHSVFICPYNISNIKYFRCEL